MVNQEARMENVNFALHSGEKVLCITRWKPRSFMGVVGIFLIAVVDLMLIGAGFMLILAYAGWNPSSFLASIWVRLLIVGLYAFLSIDKLFYLITRMIGKVILTNQRLVVKRIPTLTKSYEIALHEVRELAADSRKPFPEIGMTFQGLGLLIVKYPSGLQKKLVLPDVRSLVSAHHQFLRTGGQEKVDEAYLGTAAAAHRTAAAILPGPVQAVSDSNRAAAAASQRFDSGDTTARFCHECGTPFRSLDKFCPRCGTPRREVAFEQVPPNASGEASVVPAYDGQSINYEKAAEEYPEIAETDQKKPRSNVLQRIILVFSIIFLAGIGMIALYGFLQDTGRLPLSAAQECTTLICYDGLYRSLTPYEELNAYLRFYADGTVLAVTSAGEPSQVATWLNKKHAYSSQGQYEIQGSVVKFTVTGTQGAVDYTGTIRGDELTLDTYSQINGQKGTSVYRFVEIGSMKP
jgi:hypothetical protein